MVLLRLFLKIKLKGYKMRNILKIEIFKQQQKATIYDFNGNIDTVTFNHVPSGYVLFRSLKASDMLNIQNINYYDDLSIEQKNILDNLEEIKININNNIKSFDFISSIGKFNLLA